MKTILIISAFSLLTFVTVLTPWVITFGGALPSNVNDWASFGSYVGGTLSPIIALMALIGLLYTINQQQKQIDHLSNQATKGDIFKVIDKLENDFYKNLNRYPVNLVTPERTIKYSAVDVLFDISFPHHMETIFNSEDVQNITGDNINIDDPGILSADMFSTAAGHLNKIRIL